MSEAEARILSRELLCALVPGEVAAVGQVAELEPARGSGAERQRAWVSAERESPLPRRHEARSPGLADRATWGRKGQPRMSLLQSSRTNAAFLKFLFFLEM